MDDSISFLFIQLCRAHRNRIDSALQGIGLYAGQEGLLMAIQDHEGVTQTELADVMCVEAPTVTKMVQRMERAGLIDRRPDPDDRRVSRVFLTAEGNALVTPIRQIVTDVEANMLADLNETEQALLRRLLLQVIANLNAE